MNKTAQDIALIITTYNNPTFLELVLKSVLRQRTMPKEVIIADDGSTDETRQLVDRYRALLQVPLIHSWIPDEGFRLSKSRNVGVSKCTAKYLIFIDGDIVLSPYFIEDHDRMKEPGHFVTGSRARLGERATRQRCQTLDPKFTFFTPGLGRRYNMIHSPFLHRFIKGKTGLSHARGCHFALWKTDYIKVNGFEEKFVGWGSEDSEFFQRLLNNGIERKNTKALAAAVHLFHHESSMERKQENLNILEETIQTGRKRARIGMDQYL